MYRSNSWCCRQSRLNKYIILFEIQFRSPQAFRMNFLGDLESFFFSFFSPGVIIVLVTNLLLCWNAGKDSGKKQNQINLSLLCCWVCLLFESLGFYFSWKIYWERIYFFSSSDQPLHSVCHLRIKKEGKVVRMVWTIYKKRKSCCVLCFSFFTQVLLWELSLFTECCTLIF